jgi:hypothetical protein
VRQKTAADRRRRDLSFIVGDHVMLNTRNLELLGVSKLASRSVGPFRVAAVVSPVAYKLALPAGMRVHPVSCFFAPAPPHLLRLSLLGKPQSVRRLWLLTPRASSGRWTPFWIRSAAPVG